MADILRKHPEVLSAKELEYLAVIRAMYEQQKHVHETGNHNVDERIVSLHQPWVRQIVREKAAVPAELGAKAALSLKNVYARIVALSWDAFNENARARHKYPALCCGLLHIALTPGSSLQPGKSLPALDAIRP